MKDGRCFSGTSPIFSEDDEMSEYTDKGQIDHSLPSLSVRMTRAAMPIAEYPLPPGYRVAFYQSGDEEKWADIHLRVAQFDDRQKALECFWRNFPEKEELPRRMMFAYASDGSCAGTTTAWFDGTVGRLHWVAVDPAHKGQGLAKALVSRATALLHELHPGEIYLTSGTRNHAAIAMYEKLGYVPDVAGSAGGEEAWRIIHEANRR